MEKTVDNCPRNLTETVKASIRLGCGRDKYGNDQYMCLPNLETSSLVEFCHNGIMGLIERGNCMKTAESKFFTHQCSRFVSGCPDVDFRSNEIYKYPACQSINTENHCYLADPSCENITFNISYKETTSTFISMFTKNRVINNTTAMNIHTTKFQEDESAHIWAIMGSLIAVLGLILLFIIGRIVLKRMYRKRRKEKNIVLSEKENLFIETEKKIVIGATKKEEKTGTNNKQNESENDIIEIDVFSENEEMKQCIAEVCISYESKGNEIVDTETRVHNEPNDKKYDITEAGVNWEPGEIEHSISETDVHSELEGKEHSISEPDVNGEVQEREHDVTEAGVSSESEKRELGGQRYVISRVKEILEHSQRKQNAYFEDPSTVLTNNQRVVLYTLFLCCNVYGEIPVDSMDDTDFSMGDINVSKTLKELKDMGLIRSDSNQLFISHDKRSLIMRTYIDDCLLSDIDKDFYLEVTSSFSMIVYEEEFIFNRHVSRGLQSNCPITLMRLLVEIQTEKIYDIRMRSGPNILPPNMEMGGISRKLRDFVLRWCRLKNIVDPIAWADNLPDEGIKRFYYGSTIFPLNDTVIEGLYQNPLKSSILCTILMAEDYKISADAIKETNKDVVKAFPSLYHTELDLFLETIEEMEKRDQSLSVEVENNVIGFKSEEVRHQVMCYFVTNCLITDEDFVKYINLSSVDSLLEYVRTWWYVKGENERCLFLPNKMEAALIKALGLDAIRHVMVEKTAYIDSLVTAEIRKKVIMNVNVPEEILDWDYDARLRFIECTKKGTQTIHRARAMILGCAGAGKTTLLKRLQNKTLAELRNVTSTVGLEVYEDIFEVLRDQGCLRALAEHSNKEGKELLSIMDFGGQCAYYACHQVYLSRRAFYILVIDMSKQFKEKVDKKLCDQAGTMFTDWTYGEYLLFWMKSIHIYSAEDAPVILVGTHLDKTKGQTTETFYDSILDQLRYDEKLKAHLNRKRCFTLGIQAKDGQTLEKLSSLEKCIVSIAKEDRWKDSIPTDWAFCEATFKVLKSTNKLISLEKYSREYFNSILERNSNVQDVLKLFHEIGIILHFNEKSLSEIIILDIQWFVDAFKNIITDSNHVKDEAKNHQEWKEFDQTGYLPENFIKRIWKSMKFDTKGRDNFILQYMERLGLIAMTLDSGLRCMYVPCMNKRTFDAAHQEKLRNYQHKTSVLVFRFSFLPWFVYFRLIASCLSRTGGKWRVLNDEGMCMFKNIAFFEYEHHNIALAVDNSSIQLQVFQHGNSIVRKEITLEIRDSIERLLNELTGSFHKKIIYSVGYQCSMNDVYREYDKCFVEEKEIRGKGHIVCPRHELIHQHNLWEPDFLGYWKKDCDVHVSETVASTPRDNFIILYEEGLQKFHFKAFEKLTKVGRNAMQIYFDAVYPKKDLLKFKLSKATAVKKMFHLSDNQFERLCPTDKSDPSSQSFDVTMMYQMLRNRYPNLPQPTKGWGKTPVTGDESETDDVERIRIYRNQVVHEPDATSKLEKRDLEEKGRDLTQAIVRLSKGDPNIQHEMMNALKNPT